MAFEIKHVEHNRESFGEYQYDIVQGGRVIARYWHDYRGDYHRIEFADGKTEDCPLGRVVDFVTGGGPNPLRLSKKAIAYLNLKLTR